jgi:6-phosphogluconate dehydrogenase
LDEIVPHLSPYDIVIDGGNTNWLDDLDRASALGAQGIRLLDVGTSGGVWGLDRGYCLMVGGDTDAVATIVPILDTLSPGIDAAPRTNGRVGDPTPGETGWLHCGSAGSGHFVKMVHNGIEYGMMAALAEGLALLTAASGDVMDRLKGSETESVRAAERFDFRIDSITELWRRGSVIDSWLLDLAARALAEDASLDSYGVRVSDSGEGRWASQTGIDFALPMPVLSAALQARFASQDSTDTGNRILSALRHQFGGHEKSLVPDVS